MGYNAVQLNTCYNHNRTGTWNIHAVGFRNNLETIPCVCIIQSQSHLFGLSNIKCVYLHKFNFKDLFKVHNLSFTCGQGRGASQPKLRMKQESMMSLPSIQETDVFKKSSFSSSAKFLLNLQNVLFDFWPFVKNFLFKKTRLVNSHEHLFSLHWHRDTHASPTLDYPAVPGRTWDCNN